MSTEDHEQTRRHFDVVAEGLRSELRQVADGVALNTEALERFRAETARNFTEVRAEIRLSHADLNRRPKAVETH